MTELHISEAAMAALADGTRGSADTIAHLASCPRCAAFYSELVSRRSAWMQSAGRMPADPDIVQLGVSVAGDFSMGDDSSSTPRQRSWLLRPRRRLAVAAVVLLAVVGAFTWHDRHRLPGDIAEISRAIDQRMLTQPVGVAYSERTSFVQPGTRGALAPEELTASLDRLAEYYNRRSMRADVAYWLIGGYIAAGQMRNAEAYLREALQRFADDPRIHMLAGIVAYRQSDLATSEQEFRKVIRLQPSSGVAMYNLGVVLSEQGRREEAAAVLGGAVSALRGTPLAGQAESLLRSSSGS